MKSSCLNKHICYKIQAPKYEKPKEIKLSPTNKQSRCAPNPSSSTIWEKRAKPNEVKLLPTNKKADMHWIQNSQNVREKLKYWLLQFSMPRAPYVWRVPKSSPTQKGHWSLVTCLIAGQNKMLQSSESRNCSICLENWSMWRKPEARNLVAREQKLLLTA